MSATTDAYDRLLAARRIVTPAEREETARQSAREQLANRIRHKLAKVY